MNMLDLPLSDSFRVYQQTIQDEKIGVNVSRSQEENPDVTYWEKQIAQGMLKKRIIRACSEGFAEKLLYEAAAKIQNALLGDSFFAKFSPKKNSLEMKDGFLLPSKEGRAEFQYRGLLAQEIENSSDNTAEILPLPFELFPSTLELRQNPKDRNYVTLSTIRKNFDGLVRRRKSLESALKEVEWLESEAEMEVLVPKFISKTETEFKPVKISIKDFPEHMRQVCLKELNKVKLELQKLLEENSPQRAREEFNKSVDSLSVLKTVKNLRCAPNSYIHETLIVPTREALQRAVRPEDVRAIIEGFKKKLQVLISDIASVDEESEAITSGTLYAQKIDGIANLISREALNNIAFALQTGATEELIHGGKLESSQQKPLNAELKEKLQSLNDNEELQELFDQVIKNTFSTGKNATNVGFSESELLPLLAKILSKNRSSIFQQKFEHSKEENTYEHGTDRGLLNGSDELPIEMVRIIKEGFDSAFSGIGNESSKELMICGLGFVPFATSYEEQEKLETFLDSSEFKKANIIGSFLPTGDQNKEEGSENQKMEISPAVLSRVMFLFYRRYESYKTGK